MLAAVALWGKEAAKMSCDQDVDTASDDAAQVDTEPYEDDADGAYDRMVEERLFGDLAGI